jgi:hypothetical protein
LKAKGKHHLFPPPRILSEGEFPPVIEPPFKDMPPFHMEEGVEGFEEFESKPAKSQLTEELVRKAQAATLASEQVSQLLADKRYIPIGAGYIDNGDEKLNKSNRKETGGPPQLIFVLYNYTDNLTIEVYLDKDANNVNRVESLRYQPAPLREETEEAIQLARKDQRLADRLTEDLEGAAILVSPVDPEDMHYNHRQFDVRFVRVGDRAPIYMALVDLSIKTVLKAGSVCPQ